MQEETLLRADHGVKRQRKKLRFMVRIDQKKLSPIQEVKVMVTSRALVDATGGFACTGSLLGPYRSI